MIVDLFKIPVIIGDIDVSKINLNNKEFKKTWLSQTPSTHFQSLDGEKMIDGESFKYLMSTLVSMLKEKIKYSFDITLTNIWENHYIDNDFQEPHLHSGVDFSFIIYKDVKEGKTVFLNPIRNYLTIYKNISHMFDEHYIPKCKTGKIIIFPSFLEHMVLKSTGDKTISGNLLFKKI